MSPTDVVELKKYVKRLNAAALESNEEVCVLRFSVSKAVVYVIKTIAGHFEHFGDPKERIQGHRASH